MHSLYIKPVFRSFLAVLSSVLANDIGAQPDDLAYALGCYFCFCRDANSGWVGS